MGHFIQVSTRNQKIEDEINGVKIESVQCVTDLGVTIASNFKFFQQCTDAAGKVNKMLGFINRNFSFKNKDTVQPPYISFVRHHLDYAVQFWKPRLTKNIAKLEAVQGRTTTMITFLCNKSYEERPASLNLFSFEKHRLRSKLLSVLKYFKASRM